MRRFIKVFRALSNSRLIQDLGRDEIIAKANNDNDFCLLQQYLTENDYFQQGDSTVFVMEDPESDFKIHSFQANYSRNKDAKSAEFIFQVTPDRDNNTFISISDNGDFQEVISVGKNGKIRFNSSNFIKDIFNSLSTWLATKFRRD
jgi:hypothetical protein